MVPFEACLIDSAQASTAGCIGWLGGTQWLKRNSTGLSTGLSCANAGTREGDRERGRHGMNR